MTFYEQHSYQRRENKCLHASDYFEGILASFYSNSRDQEHIMKNYEEMVQWMSCINTSLSKSVTGFESNWAFVASIEN